MSDLNSYFRELLCKVCGHTGDHHHIATSYIRCTRCPEQRCQDGPDGADYRKKLT